MPKDSTQPKTRGRRLLTFKLFLEMKKLMESVPPSPALIPKVPERDVGPVAGVSVKT